MFYSGLKGIGATELRVRDYEPDGPVYEHRKAHKEQHARDQAGLAQSIGLANDTSTTLNSRISLDSSLFFFFFRQKQHNRDGMLSYMILFAMFMNALLIPLLGRALSSRSSALNSRSSATVTEGASISVSSGARCPVLSRLSAYPLLDM